MNLVEHVMSRPELTERPPVLIDIGASGGVHPEWKRFARHAICIAFDADERELGETIADARGFKQLHLYRKIVTAEERADLAFHLTASPYCSSTLQPATEKLADWAFAGLFDVERTVRLPATTLRHVLAEQGFSYVDWFKTDSQGTDLRLFKSLGKSIIETVLVADFEPGIIDAYEGEDKLHALLAYMDKQPFWLHKMQVKGTQRLSRALQEKHFRTVTRRAMPLLLRTTPCWAEVSFMTTLARPERFSLRDYLVAWVFATLQRQFGFALEVATAGQQRFDDPLFGRLAAHAQKQITPRVDVVVPQLARKISKYLL
jgi:hypothetical protein